MRFAILFGLIWIASAISGLNPNYEPLSTEDISTLALMLLAMFVMDVIELFKNSKTYKADKWKSLGKKLRENPKPKYPRPEPKRGMTVDKKKKYIRFGGILTDNDNFISLHNGIPTFSNQFPITAETVLVEPVEDCTWDQEDWVPYTPKGGK